MPLGSVLRPVVKRSTGGKGRRASRTYARAKSLLDAVFSRWTRLRFADGAGNVACVCCGAVRHWKLQQAGHYVKRSHLATRWEPENVAVCCYRCNVLMSGNYPAYTVWGVDRYGMDWPARMVALSKTPTKFSRSDLESMILDYEEKLKALSTVLTG